MAAREQIKHKRLEAMRDLSRKYAPTGKEEEWYKWITTPGEPPSPPHSLVAYDEHALPSFFAAPYMSDGFQGQLYFHEGDMITYAYNMPSTKLVCLLNMANAVHCGGGFLSGSRAQEEQLCHRTSLFPRLKLSRKEGLYPIPHILSLVTQNVHIFKNENFVAVTPRRISVVSAAATRYSSEKDAMNDPLSSERMLQTWRAIFAGAAQSGASCLIVSAIGAGAFCNPIDTVAECFCAAIRENLYFGFVDEIHIVIMEDHNSNGKNVSGFLSTVTRAHERDTRYPIVVV